MSEEWHQVVSRIANSENELFLETNVSFIPFFVFGFWSLLATKLRKYYVIFVYILQGKMGKMEKNQKENYATKVTKIPKTKRRKYGMNETKSTLQIQPLCICSILSPMQYKIIY